MAGNPHVFSDAGGIKTDGMIRGRVLNGIPGIKQAVFLKQSISSPLGLFVDASSTSHSIYTPSVQNGRFQPRLSD